MKFCNAVNPLSPWSCRKCGRVLPIKAFCINGTGYYEHICKECKANDAREKYATEKANSTDKYWKKRFDALYRNSIRRGFEFHITIEDLKKCFEHQRGRCWYTGDPLVSGSVDRIDPNRGYYPDNIIMCERRINLFRGDMFRDDFLALCRKIANNHKEKGDD